MIKWIAGIVAALAIIFSLSYLGLLPIDGFLLSMAGYEPIVFDLGSTMSYDMDLKTETCGSFRKLGVGRYVTFSVPSGCELSYLDYNVGSGFKTLRLDGYVVTQGVTVRVPSGTKQYHVCGFREVKCEGSRVVVCGEDYLGWDTVETCEFGCEKGYCKASPDNHTEQLPWLFIGAVGALAVMVAIGVKVFR